MPEERLSMRKIREVLRLSAMGLSQHEIARSCSIVQSTVHKYLKLAKAANLTWPLPDDWGDGKISEVLLGSPKPPQRRRKLPDFATLHKELETHKNLTLELLWQEYRQDHPQGYGYSRFCELYNQWCGRQQLTMRFDHTPGEKMFADYAGDTLPIHDPETGQIHQAAIFVAVLGFSCYTFAEATWSQQLPCWLSSHMRAFEFFSGVPSLVVVDNTTCAVKKPHRYEPDLNPTYQDMAIHYGTAVMPARPRKPRDKAKVENGVQVVQRWIVAGLRKRTFFSLSEVNEAIGELLLKLNTKPMRKRGGATRAALFNAHDKPALQALPTAAFTLGQWSHHKVDRDYHVPAADHFYSVPYQLVGQRVDIRLTASSVEIFHKGLRVATHSRNTQPGRERTTIDAHRPDSHQRYLEWTPSKLMAFGQSVGPQTARLFEQILASKPHPEIGFRCCIGIARLADKHGAQRLEAAAGRALFFGMDSLKQLASILDHRLEEQPLPACAEPARPALLHDNLRGAHYYDAAVQ